MRCWLASPIPVDESSPLFLRLLIDEDTMASSSSVSRRILLPSNDSIDEIYTLLSSEIGVTFSATEVFATMIGE